MSSNWDFFDLVLGASPVVQGVLLMLLAASVYSWMIIFDRIGVLRKAKAEAETFEKQFWAGGDLAHIYKRVTGRGKTLQGLEQIFDTGFREFARLNDHPEANASYVIRATERAMRLTLMKEVERLEHNLPTLATVGSTSPYVGLFGTVWGIINAFTSLGQMKTATLATVAPGIAEALIATAIGLFAAIPAVIAYNRFADRVDRLEKRYRGFVGEFSALLRRHLHDAPRSAAA